MSVYRRWLEHLHLHRRGIFLLRLYGLLFFFIGFSLGVVTYFYCSESPFGDNHDKHALIESLNSELKLKLSELASKEMELAVSQQSSNDLKEMFAKQLEQEKQLQRELSFYRSVMAPEKIADGVVIQGVELRAGLLAGQQRLELVLMQLQKRKQPIKGMLNVKLIGVKNNQRTSFMLNKIIKKKLDFNFRYFQLIDAEFVLPAEFELARIEVKVVIPRSRWTKGAQMMQTFTIPEISEQQKEPSIILEQITQVKDNQS